MRLNKNIQGNITIELIIIFPIVLLIVFVLFNISILLYQKAFLNIEISNVVKQNINYNINMNNKYDILNLYTFNLYKRAEFIDNIKKDLSKNTYKDKNSIFIDINSPGIFDKKLNVALKIENKNIFYNILKSIGSKKIYSIDIDRKICSKKLISNINDIDFLYKITKNYVEDKDLFKKIKKGLEYVKDKKG